MAEVPEGTATVLLQEENGSLEQGEGNTHSVVLACREGAQKAFDALPHPRDHRQDQQHSPLEVMFCCVDA